MVKEIAGKSEHMKMNTQHTKTYRDAALLGGNLMPAIKEMKDLMSITKSTLRHWKRRAS